MAETVAKCQTVSSALLQKLKKRMDKINNTCKNVFMPGLAASWPICLGYIPIGIAFGVLAGKAGLTPFEIGLMSVVVFAGSAQFIAVSMIASGTGATAIIATAFIVNLRHLLMSSALAVFLKPEKRRKLSLFAYGVTDESFAINYSRFKTGKWNLNQALVLNHTANLVWVGSTVAGGFSGALIPDGAFGIDYALIAMFICLLVFQLRGRIYIITAVMAGIFAVIFALIIPGNLHVIIGSVLAVTICVFIKTESGENSDG
ncbi:AzlC family ABC transporter permease [Desulfococcaceae bacterium HSG9]|nr:AzlC family ABC transporter permease [Desulfococcaceae bacterium HSG9]